MPVIVVGINPNNKEHHKNSTVKKLQYWMDVMGITEYDFTNCIPTIGEYKKDMIDYNRLKENVNGYNKVLALGGFVSDALKKIKVQHHKLPHPSPRNRMLNDHLYEINELKECRSYLCQKTG